jgi:hypothetical protein
MPPTCWNLRGVAVLKQTAIPCDGLDAERVAVHWEGGSEGARS